MAKKQRNPGCTAPYTWKKVKGDVVHLYSQLFSLRGVAREYGKPITHGDIQRILQGTEPRDPHKRKALNLSVFVPAPACPKHGIAHCYDCESQMVVAKRMNGNHRKRTPPVRIGEVTADEMELIKLLSPVERKNALVEAACNRQRKAASEDE